MRTEYNNLKFFRDGARTRRIFFHYILLMITKQEEIAVNYW